MNEVTKIFNYENGSIRTLNINGDPWFVAKDICERLGYVWQNNIISHVPEEWKGVNPFNTPGGIQKIMCLSEQGLYFFLA